MLMANVVVFYLLINYKSADYKMWVIMQEVGTSWVHAQALLNSEQCRSTEVAPYWRLSWFTADRHWLGCQRMKRLKACVQCTGTAFLNPATGPQWKPTFLLFLSVLVLLLSDLPSA